MQTLTRKIFYFFLIFVSIYPQITHSQSNYTLIDNADSLFTKKKFIQSGKIYEQLFYKEGKYTPRMLLKMAYIYEGNGNFPKALYFLNLYNTINPSSEILEKMENIADEYQLKGYEYNDSEYFLFQYYRYHTKIMIVLLGFGFLAFVYVVLKRNLPVRIVRMRALIVGIYLATIFYMLDNHYFKKGIIITSHAILLDEPSAGGNYITTISEGNRLKILEKNDIWYKVKWDDRIAYIREKNLEVLNH